MKRKNNNTEFFSLEKSKKIRNETSAGLLLLCKAAKIVEKGFFKPITPSFNHSVAGPFEAIAAAFSHSETGPFEAIAASFKHSETGPFKHYIKP